MKTTTINLPPVNEIEASIAELRQQLAVLRELLQIAKARERALLVYPIKTKKGGEV